MAAPRSVPVLLCLLLAGSTACSGGGDSEPDDGLGAPAATAAESGDSADAAKRPSKADPGPPPDLSELGVINGVVLFQGQPPARRKLVLDGTPGCAMHHEEPLFTEDYEIQQGKVKNAVVYIQRGLHPSLEYPVPDEPVTLDQVGCVFKPHVLAVRAGQPILLSSGDDEAHNVNAKARRNAVVNFTMPPRASGRELVLERPEVAIPVSCGVHPWMKAYIAVFDNPFFDVTDEFGLYSIPDVPEGDYIVRVWHEKLGWKEAAVKVRPKATPSKTFLYDESDVK